MELSELQRARMVSAMFGVVCERGAQNVRVAHVVDRSGVSRRTFYEVFRDREDCLVAAFDEAVAYASDRVLGAFEASTGAWRERVRGGLVALLGFLDEQPTVGRLLVCESLAGGGLVLARRARVLESVAGVIDRGRGEAKDGWPVGPLVAEGVVGGVLAVIQARLSEEDHGELTELANPLMSMIVLPYLGAAAARKELTRATPRPPGSTDNGATTVSAASSAVSGPASNAAAAVGVLAAGDPTMLTDSFRATGTRLTYRVVRVLLAIAEHPGGSNRLIGQAAGVTDQGQISKLLTRLQGRGLITNTRTRTDKGAPNSWQLTVNGQQIIHSIHTHPTPQRRDRHTHTRGGRQRRP